MKKPNFQNEIINWKKHYLLLFEEAVIYNLQQGKTPEEIIHFTRGLDYGVMLIAPALIAGFGKYTTIDDRQKVLLKIEKDYK